ncbi:Hypothetical protein R9X50_00795100 [Acrodontium crateriforme]|uniref:PCI domain-containing protein n=1 Tax=Acrodontium crateriforme TaxID=150365 RepID=A0AAQ3MAH2_9PEZI|nr:Hypothetical protein R9X50_00795100 [Acrodontium crateriforme]
MDQSRALDALGPYLALAKSANSPRAASDLITQATSNLNTYVFAELLNQPNIQSLSGNEQYGGYYEILKVFAWGTWKEYKSLQGLPELSKAQAQKLRILSLLTIASQPATKTSNLTYASLRKQLDLATDFELEQLVTSAIYANLLHATLNPTSQIVVITSVAPLRDLAPGSLSAMISELSAWSGRCDSVLSSLEAEIEKVKSDAKKRATREARADKQIKAVTDAGEKSAGMGQTGGKITQNPRNTRGRDELDDDDDEDVMDLDGSSLGGGGGKKRSGGAFGRLAGRGVGR